MVYKYAGRAEEPQNGNDRNVGYDLVYIGELWEKRHDTDIFHEFGIFGQIGDEYIPAGFNAWRECDGELAIGEVTEMDTFRIEGIDKVMRGINAPLGFWKCEDLQEQKEKIIKNMRALLQLFDIKVLFIRSASRLKGQYQHRSWKG